MKRRPRTTLVNAGRSRLANFDFVNPPLVRGSTVLHASVADMKERSRLRAAGHDEPVNYGLYGTATHQAFYEALNELEGGYRSWALPSGLAACSMSILAQVRSGDEVLVSDAAYGPTRQFCLDTLPRFGVSCRFFEPTIGDELESMFTPATRVVVLESPSSLTFEMQDVPRLAAIARRRDAITIVDNTWATPLFFRPLQHGADIVVHAATKYIGGHSDLLLGTITSNERAWPALRKAWYSFGLSASPDDVYIAYRGLHTLAARLTAHRATAELLIAWLQQQPEVERVLYPALADDPGHALWKRDMTGATGLFGFVLRPEVSTAAMHALIDGVRLFGRGYSWGGYLSLLIAVHPDRALAPCPWASRLLRISAGLEDPDDLIEDLERGFAALRAVR